MMIFTLFDNLIARMSTEYTERARQFSNQELLLAAAIRALFYSNAGLSLFHGPYRAPLGIRAGRRCCLFIHLKSQRHNHGSRESRANALTRPCVGIANNVRNPVYPLKNVDSHKCSRRS